MYVCMYVCINICIYMYIEIEAIFCKIFNRYNTYLFSDYATAIYSLKISVGLGVDMIMD